MIEVLVAMVLLAIGMMGGLGLLEAGRTAASSGDRISRATALAEQRMEGLLAHRYEDLLGEGSGMDRPPGFIRTWEIQPDAPRPDMVLIRVSVRWPVADGKWRRVRLGAVRAAGVYR